MDEQQKNNWETPFVESVTVSACTWTIKIELLGIDQPGVVWKYVGQGDMSKSVKSGIRIGQFVALEANILLKYTKERI